MGTLYDELGARPDASTAELRRAYRSRARQLHPDLRADLRADSGAGGESDAGEPMARLNAAWRVLGDPEARRRYDLELALASAQARAARMVADGTWHQRVTAEPASPVAPPGAPGSALPRPRVRASVWAVMVAVLVAIFVFTAYAADRPSAPKPGKPGQCVSTVAQVNTYVPCTQPNVGRLVVEVPPDQACPDGTFRHLFPARNVVACVTRA